MNYTPLYYLINGVAFDKTNASASLFPASCDQHHPCHRERAGALVNAGSAHARALNRRFATTGTARSLPGFSLIAEDGNPLPGIPRVQNEVFMAAGKTYDVMINAPAPGAIRPAQCSIVS